MNFSFLNLLRDFCESISEIICYELDLKQKVNKKKLISFIFKTHDAILKFFIIHLLVFNFFSIFFFFKKFSSIDLQKKIYIKKKILSLNFLKGQIIFEIIHAILILNIFNSEKISKKKINLKNENYIKNNFFENIIIGSGPGGSVTAVELAKKEKNCLIIEKGNHWTDSQNKHPFEEFKNKWKYGGFTATLDNKMIQYASAECFGGGSEINSGLYHPISEEFLKKYLKSEIDYEYLSQSEIEKIINTNTKNKNSEKVLDNLVQNFEKGSKSLNWNIEKISRFQDENLKRNSMSKTYLKKYIQLGGSVLTNSEVYKIKKIEKGKYKVKVKMNKQKLNLFCKNIFLCCGAPYTYELLKKSKLYKNKINNFHFHPMVKIIVKYPNKVNQIKSIDVISDQITHFYPKYIFGNAASGLPFMLISAYNNKKAYEDIKKNYENMTVFHSTFSFGSGRILKIPFIKDSFITYKFNNNYFNLVEEALNNLIKFAFNSGAEKVYIIDKKISEIKSMDYKEKNYKINANLIKFSAVHLLGGIKIKKNNEIDEFGKLINENIFINDSSLIYEHLLKNPQGTLMSICLRNIKKNLNRF